MHTPTQPQTITPTRWDFDQTDMALVSVSNAEHCRDKARSCERRGEPSVAKVYRNEMRFHARNAVKFARRYRADRAAA